MYTVIEKALLFIKLAIVNGKILLFIDMDGTLADFYNHPGWYEEMYNSEWFKSLKPYDTLIATLKRFIATGRFEVFIFSAALTEDVCAAKNEWLDKHAPFIDANHRIFVPCRNEDDTPFDKGKVFEGVITKDCILIDDYNKNLIDWEKTGGTGIKFRNEVNGKGQRGEPWNGFVVDYNDTLMADHILTHLEQKDGYQGKVCLCLLGPSGVGKTTVEKYLKDRGYSSVASYTTRAPRYEGEEGHIFLTDEEFDALPPLVAFTNFNGNRYGVTGDVVDNADVYVIDVYGVRELRQKYAGSRRLVVVGLVADEDECRKRMEHRGDKTDAVDARIAHDRKAFKGMESVCDYLIPAVEANTTAHTVEEILAFHNAHPTCSPEEAIRFYRSVERGEV